MADCVRDAANAVVANGTCMVLRAMECVSIDFPAAVPSMTVLNGSEQITIPFYLNKGTVTVSPGDTVAVADLGGGQMVVIGRIANATDLETTGTGGGGGGDNIYTADGTLTADRTLTGDNKFMGWEDILGLEIISRAIPSLGQSYFYAGPAQIDHYNVLADGTIIGLTGGSNGSIQLLHDERSTSTFVGGFEAYNAGLNLIMEGGAALQLNDLPGSAGQVLTSAGAGAAAYWGAAAGAPPPTPLTSTNPVDAVGASLPAGTQTDDIDLHHVEILDGATVVGSYPADRRISLGTDTVNTAGAGLLNAADVTEFGGPATVDQGSCRLDNDGGAVATGTSTTSAAVTITVPAASNAHGMRARTDVTMRQHAFSRRVDGDRPRIWKSTLETEVFPAFWIPIGVTTNSAQDTPTLAGSGLAVSTTDFRFSVEMPGPIVAAATDLVYVFRTKIEYVTGSATLPVAGLRAGASSSLLWHMSGESYPTGITAGL